MAVVVSADVDRWNARLSDSTSYKIAPKAKMSARWSARFSAYLFGRHVTDCAHHYAGIGSVGLGRPDAVRLWLALH
jgi:hypothetical protein